jgi:hypothetical protein
MPDCTRHRVARRFLEARSQRSSSVVHVDPLGHRWGWFTERLQRLHLRPHDPRYREAASVWLEDLFGRRAFEIERHPPNGSPLDLDELRQSVAEARDTIEAAWLRRASLLGWLEYNPNPATVLLYPGSRFEVRRELGKSTVEPGELQVEPGYNVVYAGFPLNRLIWQGRDDGSDAAVYSFSTGDEGM